MYKVLRIFVFVSLMLIVLLSYNKVVQAGTLEDGEWEGTFYPRDNFTGMPVKESFESIDFNWKGGSPSPKIPSDHFSAFFSREFELDEGIYNLRVWANDGVQVFVDGKLHIDQWNSTSINFFAKPIYLEAGKHRVEIKYKEITGWAELRFEMDDLMRENRWYGMAFSNADLSGHTKLLGYDPQIPELDLDWGRGSPGANIPSDNFSALFQRKINVDEGAYNLRVWANDGVQVYVDGKLQIDEWDNNQGLKFFGKPVYLSSGNHTIHIKYKELVGLAKLKFEIDDLMRDDRWYGLGFPTDNLTGDPKLLGYKPQIPELNLDWGSGSPIGGLPANKFSTIFQRNINVESGIYNLDISTNSGFQVLVDGKLEIDKWKNSKSNSFSEQVYLESGKHDIKIKLKKTAETADLKFDINKNSNLSSWQGIAYSNSNFTGSKVILGESKKIEKLDFDWGSGSPGNGIPNDNFSTAFQKEIDAEEGFYNIKLLANDGVQVLIDGEIQVDKWESKGLNEYEVPIHLSKGSHTILVKYKELTGVARLSFDIQHIKASDSWQGIFFPTPNLTGDSRLVNNIDTINFNWGKKGPVSDFPSDNFSAVFNKKFTVNEGAYNLRVWANDGVQVYVDGKLEIDEWDNDQGLKFFGKPVYLSSGEHTIQIKYKELVGLAELRFEIDDLMRENRWYGLAFPNDDLTGNPELLGYDPQIPELNLDWGRGSPSANIPSDNFSTLFQRKINVDEGAYNLRVWANDGVQVYVDGKLEIDEWDNDQGLKFFGKPVYLSAGEHTVLIKHKELVGLAELRFEIDDLMRDNRWFGLAFPNNDLTGNPELLGYDPQIPELNLDWGRGSPSANIPSDNFSTLFQRKINVDEGAYNLRVWANDGVQVYVDGKLEIDEWDNDQGLKFFGKPVYLSAGEHTVLIKHKELVGLAELRFEIDDLMRDDRWYGLAFPKKDLTGNPKLLGYDPQIQELNLNWGTGSPAEGIPVDNFSTMFQRNIETGTGKYKLKVAANDGVRVFIDNSLVLDEWDNKSNGYWDKTLNLTAGKHKIFVQQYEETGISNLNVSLEPYQSIDHIYESYNLSLDEMVNIQMKVNPQTDKKYKLWIREDGLTVNKPQKGQGTVKGNGWNLRRGPGTQYIAGGQLNKGDVVTLYSATKDSAGYNWYHVRNTSGWVLPDKADLKYYLNPNNFTNSFKNKLQFAKLSQSAGIDPQEVNDKILNNRGVLDGKAQSFINAGEKYGVNEIYLISHALLETGNGASKLATGITVDGEYGKKKVYNMYGIGAKDSCPLECGSRYAYNAKWFSVEAAIEGGAEFIGKGYIDKNQDTLYKMRFNPSYASQYKKASHQYATDIGWGYKQTSKMNEIYELIELYSITFEIPLYK
ncbi:hypothetical protein OBCHQ24_16330 [Oceanobacillus iheyensis]|nr:hypothetical protein OBCHQ24_16330 [Oceanobacillus iheyensis]